MPRKSGLPPFHEELVKLLGVEDPKPGSLLYTVPETPTEDPEFGPNPCKEVWLKQPDEEPKKYIAGKIWNEKYEPLMHDFSEIEKKIVASLGMPLKFLKYDTETIPSDQEKIDTFKQMYSGEFSPAVEEAKKVYGYDPGAVPKDYTVVTKVELKDGELAKTLNDIFFDQMTVYEAGAKSMELCGPAPPEPNAITKQAVDELINGMKATGDAEKAFIDSLFSLKDVEIGIPHEKESSKFWHPSVGDDEVTEFFGEETSDPLVESQEPIELVELTLTGLTHAEVNAIMKTVAKSKTEQNILVHKKVRKEIGSKSEPVVVWPFESSSMQVNGEPIMYKAQLNKDGSLSCNCMGWTMGSAKSSGGRRCKHTDTIEVEAQSIYKKWKKGEPLGENYEVASAAVAGATSKTLSKALKEKTVNDSGLFVSKRIVEI